MFFLFKEYSNQLPSEGGAFYHPDTVDSAIHHYRKSWPAILHGLSIWLEDTGFQQGGPNADENPLTASQTARLPANMRPRTINQDRFFLILGIFKFITILYL